MSSQRFTDDVSVDANDVAGDFGPAVSRHERYRDQVDNVLDDDASTQGRFSGERLHVDLTEPATSRQDDWTSRIVDKIPVRLRRYGSALSRWVQGPDPPRIYSITPIFAKLQHAPITFLDRIAPRSIHRFALLIGFYIVWFLAFLALLWKSSFASTVPGYGAPLMLSCGTSLWSINDACGLNGDQCRPFNGSTLAFRCPAQCKLQNVYQPHAVGAQQINYQPFVIGGPTNESDPVGSAVYRADSLICQAGVHTGFVSDSQGGCGALDIVGEYADFKSVKRNGLSSIAFDSYFVKSFSFNKDTRKQCSDQRVPVIVVSVLATVLLSLFTVSPAVFFWSIFVGLFIQTALVTDAPNRATYTALISLALERLLPAAFCMGIIYRYTVRRTLAGLTAQVEKTVLWLGMLWVGALNNVTLDRLPIRRLTTHDLKTQSGAIFTLVVIVLLIFAIALAQAWCFRVEGRMPRYLALYGAMGGSLLIMIAIPGMNLRIHHYILALLLLPGTSIQTRLSLASQGLLVGLFLNGIARWGFDGLLQLPADLFHGDHMGSLLPIVTAPLVGWAGSMSANVTFELGPLPSTDKADRKYDGYSILVNEVERVRTYKDTNDAHDWLEGNLTWTWNRHIDGLPEYFRFAYMTGASSADYTKAATWNANGTWTMMEPGPGN